MQTRQNLDQEPRECLEFNPLSHVRVTACPLQSWNRGHPAANICLLLVCVCVGERRGNCWPRIAKFKSQRGVSRWILGGMRASVSAFTHTKLSPALFFCLTYIHISCDRGDSVVITELRAQSWAAVASWATQNITIKRLFHTEVGVAVGMQSPVFWDITQRVVLKLTFGLRSPVQDFPSALKLKC